LIYRSDGRTNFSLIPLPYTSHDCRNCFHIFLVGFPRFLLRSDPFLLNFAISSSSSVAALLRLRIPTHLTSFFPLTSLNHAWITPSRRHILQHNWQENESTSEKSIVNIAVTLFIYQKLPCLPTILFIMNFPPPPVSSSPSNSDLGFISSSFPIY